MTKPRITKHGIWWQVHINGRLHAAHRTHHEAWERAWAIAVYAQRIRERKEVQRIQQAVTRMDERRA